MRRAIGITAAVLGGLAVLASVLAVTGGIRWLTGRTAFRLIPRTPLVQGSRSVAVTPGAQVTVTAVAAHVTVHADGAPGHLRVHYDLPRGSFFLTGAGPTVMVGDRGSHLHLGFVGGVPTLAITVPPGVNLTIQAQAGPVEVSGSLNQIVVSAAAGSVSLAPLRASHARVTDAAGSITATFVNPPQFLSVQDSAGSISLSGPWARQEETVRALAGSVTLMGRPRVGTAVTVNVSAGRFHSGFRSLGSGSNGQFSGTVGPGTVRGQLSITSQAGSVTLTP